MRTLKLSFLVFAAVLASNAAAQEPQHFSSKGKAPSQYTVQAQQEQRKILPLADKRDFDEAKRGFIAAPPYRKIMNDKGDVAWNMDNWNFLLNGTDGLRQRPSFASASSHTQHGIWIVRGCAGYLPGTRLRPGEHLLIKGKTWIVIDPLTVKETANAALKFVNEKLGARPVVVVITSHSHADHFGGVRGVVEADALAAGKVQIIAPKGFIYESISENLFGGNAMTRRKTYTYGDLLPTSPYGQVDASIGKGVANGDMGILPLTKVIDQPIEEITIDGARMAFQNTPGTETPPR